MYTIEKQSNVCTSIKVDSLKTGEEQWFLLCSDIHFDSQKCDRKTLTRHFDQAKGRGAGILINGDLFDVMQGRNDNRRASGAKLSELLTGAYFNRVVDIVHEFLSPYSDNLVYIGKGNHETSVEKHNDIDLIEVLKYKLLSENPGMMCSFGLYESFFKFRVNYHSTRRRRVTMYAHHGASCVSPVTRGVIEFARLGEVVPQADIVWLGHNHQRNMMFRNYLYINQTGGMETREKVFIRSGAYKKDDHGEGWAKEKGMPPSNIGSWWLRFYLTPEGLQFQLLPTD